MGIPFKSIEEINLKTRDDGLFDISAKAWFKDGDDMRLGIIEGVAEISGNITLVPDPSREDNVIFTLDTGDKMWTVEKGNNSDT